MNRRVFLSAASAALPGLVLARNGYAAQQCTQPTQTPYGYVERCTAGIQSINLQQAYQQQSEWCWAASISMLFEFHGHMVSQQRIVAETWGAIANMPGQPMQILSDLNRTWKDDNGKSFRTLGDMRSVNIYTAVDDLKNDDPLIIGALGHATVLTAITGDINMTTGAWQIAEVIVRDPWPGNGGRRALTPMEWGNLEFAARVRVE